MSEKFEIRLDPNKDIDYFRTALPVCAALALFLLSAGFIAYKLITAYRYNERWKDYDECGLS